MSARLRAFFVFGAIFAVTMGLLAPALSRPIMQLSHGAVVGCPHHHLDKDALVDSRDEATSHAPRHSGVPGCPDCCLAAAHLGKAVLPFRSASFARLERRVASRMRYADYAASAVTPVAAEPANGARAPPAA